MLADMMTVGGVRLFWPNRTIAVFPGRDEYRVMSGRGSERVFLVVALCAALVLYPLSQQGLQHLLYGLRPGEDLRVPMEKVIDGDTAEVHFGAQAKTVRFIGVDTPETVDPTRPLECYGPEASDFTKKNLEGQVVRITLPSLGNTTDAYGRTLVYVYYDLDGNGKEELFNLELLKRGYAKTTTFDHEFRREFSSAERTASEQGMGLWGACPGEEPVSSGRLF
jgi:endonuclease YncB( thermonuclease family)